MLEAEDKILASLQASRK